MNRENAALSIACARFFFLKRRLVDEFLFLGCETPLPDGRLCLADEGSTVQQDKELLFQHTCLSLANECHLWERQEVSIHRSLARVLIDGARELNNEVKGCSSIRLLSKKGMDKRSENAGLLVSAASHKKQDLGG